MKKLLIFFLLFLLVIPAFGEVKESNPATVETSAKIKVATAEAEVRASTKEAVAKNGIKFKDLTPKHPAYPYVMQMVVSYEVISGYPDGTFKGNKTINRAEFSKVMTNALAYLEKKYDIPLADETTLEVKFKDLNKKHWSYHFVTKLVTKYKILSGYPDGTFKPNKTINRFELATVLAKTLRLIHDRYEMTLPTLTKEVVLADVKSKHWAMKDIQLLLTLKIMGTMRENKKLVFKGNIFKGNKYVTRFDTTIAGARLIGLSDSSIAALPKEKLEALKRKYLPAAVLPPGIPSLVAKALEISSKPQATITAGWGNVYEGASGTDNWMGFSGSLSYGDVFRVWMFSGNYEIVGKYGFNQINYLVPAGAGSVRGGVVNENRYELELNTIYPVVEFYGVSGKLLLGAKYINLSNPTAPTNFTGFNAGFVTSAKVLDKNFLLRGFYSLPLVRSSVSSSVLGQPVQLFNYEASLDAEILSYPVLLGFSGETMMLSGGAYRYYNMFFARYFLI